MRYTELVEATRPHVEKIVDPALLTYDEYVKLVNPKDKSHPSDAYDWSIKRMREFGYNARENFPILLNQIKVKGEPFEVRLKRIDKWELEYTRTDKDGWVVRDESGDPMYLTPEEVRATVRPRYEHMVGIFNAEGENVAIAQDEWGTWLMVVAQEYRGRGLGVILGKYARGLEPEKQSGGFTAAGGYNFRLVHRAFVKEYLASGMYSHLVRGGRLSMERVHAILKSIGETEGERLWKEWVARGHASHRQDDPLEKFRAEWTRING